MKFLSNILAKAGLTVDGVVTFNNTATGQTPATNDNSTKLATTEFIKNQSYLTANQTITVSGDATGSGVTSIVLTLANSGVTAGSYGNASNIPTITVDAKGRITSISTNAVSIITTLAGLSDVTLTSPSANQVLQYNGTQWVNGAAPTSYTLPIASGVTLGGIKIGSGLSINGSGIVSVAASGVGAIRALQQITATAGQTVFTVSGGYTPGLIDVFINGVLLTPTAITSTNGNTFTLTDAAIVNDLLDVFVYNPIYNGFISTTDQVPEGATNLYYTNARARASISLTTTGSTGAATYNSATGVLNIPSYVGGVVSIFGRTGTVIAVSGDYTTTLVTEGTNLYYTDARARAAISVTGSGSYNSATGVITVTGGVTSVNTLTGAVVLTTTNIAEGTNLYYTDARVLAYLTANSYATQTYVGTQIANLVAAAPATLDTLNELAAALGNDPSFATTVATSIGTKVPQTRTITINGTAYDLSANRSWTIASGVTSFNTRTGAITPTSGDYTTALVTESGNLYYTDSRARLAISLTTTGTSGAATYTSGVLNIPQYQAVLTNPVTGSGTTNYLPKFTGTSTIGNSSLQDDGAGTLTYNAPSSYNATLSLNGSASNAASVNFFQGGTKYFFVGSDSSANFRINSYTGATFNGVAFYIPTGTTRVLLGNNVTDNGSSTLQVLGGTYINGILQATGQLTLGSTITNGTYTYTLPSATGTLALTSDLSSYTPTSRTLTINGTAYDLTADRTWTIGVTPSARTIQTYTATAAQTTFTVTGGYVVGLVDVFINGVRLTSADFTATNGTTVVLTTGTGVNNIVDVIKYTSAFTASSALRQVSYFTATAGQTTFTVSYTPGLIDVFYNGSKLAASEYTASNGTTVVLANAAVVNDALEIISYAYSVGAFSGQTQLNGTGLVRMSGTTVSYDNATYATQSYVTTAVANLVNSAPSTLDTLNELATALGNDANFATTITTSIATKQPQLNGTGFVKISGTTISYDNSTYLTTGTASSTYLPLAGGTLTGALGGTSATFSSTGSFGNGTLNGAYFIIRAANNAVPATTGITSTAVLRLSSGTGLYNVLDFGTNEASDYSWIQSTRANSLGTYDKLLLQPNGGNIIIGSVTAGTSKLSIFSANDQAGIYMKNTYDNNAWSIRTGTPAVSNKGLAFYDEVNTRTTLQLADNGSVAINTTSATAQGLTIYQGGSDKRILLELNRPNISGLQTAIQFTVGGSIMVGQIQHEYEAANLNHMSFSLRNSGGSNFVSLWLRNDGNVAIGNSSPSTKLVVNNAISGAILPYIQGTGLSYNSEGISVTGSNTANANVGNGITLYNNVASVGAYSPVIAFSSMTAGGSYNATYAFISGVYQGSGGDANWAKGDLIFGTGNGYGAQIRMRLQATGGLHINRASYLGDGYGLVIGSEDANLQCTAMMIKNNGNNCVNFFNASTTYVASISINASTVTYGTGSDYRLKEDLKDFNGLDKVSEIKVYDFKYKVEGDRMEGVLAHELQEVIPYAVTGYKDELDNQGNAKIQNVDYSKLVPVLVKAIQELKAEIDILKAR